MRSRNAGGCKIGVMKKAADEIETAEPTRKSYYIIDRKAGKKGETNHEKRRKYETYMTAFARQRE